MKKSKPGQIALSLVLMLSITNVINSMPTMAAENGLTIEDYHTLDNEVGYLNIPGTVINYPVMQADNNDFYLKHDIFGNKDEAGCIFMDFENDVTKEDCHIVIYGHNMESNIMFHGLRYYVDEDYYKKHPVILFTTCEGAEQTWEIFSFYKAYTDYPFNTVIFDDPMYFDALVRGMRFKSLYDIGIKVTGKDRVLTLVTCTNEDTETRFVLNARLVK